MFDKPSQDTSLVTSQVYVLNLTYKKIGLRMPSKRRKSKEREKKKKARNRMSDEAKVMEKEKDRNAEVERW